MSAFFCKVEGGGGDGDNSSQIKEVDVEPEPIKDDESVPNTEFTDLNDASESGETTCDIQSVKTCDDTEDMCDDDKDSTSDDFANGKDQPGMII